MYFDAEFAALPATPTTARLKTLPGGNEGLIATLDVMRDLTRAAIRAPDQKVRGVALNLVKAFPRQWFAQARALQQYVQDSISYVRDPVGVELVQTPEKTLELRAGDCDDQATLLAALLESVGHPARFMAIRIHGSNQPHVMVQTKVNSTGDDKRDWATAETIIKRPLGWHPPGVAWKYIKKV